MAIPERAIGNLIAYRVPIELLDLQTFLAVYRAGNLTRASGELALSQPAVTAHIKALESELGKPLFVRRARGVSPTALADTLARQVAGPLDELAAATTRLGPGADPVDATLYLGGPADASSSLVLPALASLAVEGLRIRAVTGLAAELIAALGASQLDLVIATTPTHQLGVTLEPLIDEALVLVAAPQVATDAVVVAVEVGGPHALSGIPVVAFSEENPLIRRYWRTVFGTTRTPPPRIVLPDLRGVLATVATGAGWSVLPTYLADPTWPTALFAASTMRPNRRPTRFTWLPARAGEANPTSAPRTTTCSLASPARSLRPPRQRPGGAAGGAAWRRGGSAHQPRGVVWAQRRAVRPRGLSQPPWSRTTAGEWRKNCSTSRS